MAALRPVEERDKKGNTTRVNPSVTFKQDRDIRVVVGRHDFRLEPNPDFHPPITAQVQDGRILFFTGTPDTRDSRAAAKEMSLDHVPAYIVQDLKRNPLKVREVKPTVYEVRLATVGDVPVAQVSELSAEGDSVTVTPVDPDLSEEALRRATAKSPLAEASA